MDVNDSRFKVPYAETLDGVLGLKIISLEDGEISGEMAVSNACRQPFGLVHGGVYASIAESLASIASGATTGESGKTLIEEGKLAQGLSNSTNFMRPVLEGTIHAKAIRLHKGRTTHIWDVTCSDDQGRACAVTRVVIAIR